MMSRFNEFLRVVCLLALVVGVRFGVQQMFARETPRPNLNYSFYHYQPPARYNTSLLSCHLQPGATLEQKLSATFPKPTADLKPAANLLGSLAISGTNSHK